MSSFAELSRWHLHGGTQPPAQDDAIWEETPVSPQEFCERFLKEPLFPKQQAFVEAMLGTDPVVWDTRYTEGLALWGKGSGKDRTAAKILTYVCYKLLCMKDAPRYFGMGRGDKIELVNVSINGHLAETVFFAYFRRFVERTVNPKTGRNWFAEKGLDLQKDIVKREIRFPRDITAYSLNSEEYTGEGLNLFVVILDEIAAFEPLRAKELYTNLRTSCRSRFPQHMKMVLLSYKRSDNDFMMLRFREAERESTTYRDKAATWEVNLTKTKAGLAADYTSNPEDARRIYECEGSSAEDSYYGYRSRTTQVLRATPKENPIEGDKVWTYNLRSLQFKPWFKREVGARYFLHVDLAAGRADACGIAMGHAKPDMLVSLPPEFVQQVLKREGTDLSAQQGTRKPGVVLDLVVQVRAHKGGEIIFEEVRQFIERLKTVHHIEFQKVTFDGWQSLDSIQQLKQAGIAAAIQSIDKTPEAHQTLKGLIYQGLLECYEHPILLRELDELIVTPDGRADHPVYSLKRAAEEDGINRGSKDVADAAAGCALLCLQEKKSDFHFGTLGDGEALKDRPDLQRKLRDALRYESEELVHRGEKPPSWYRRFPW